MLAEVEAAVQAVKSVETLEIIGKLLYNCAVSPREEKYRRVKLTNKKVADTIGSAHGEHCSGSQQRGGGCMVLSATASGVAGTSEAGLEWVGILAPAACMR
jgi:hypothetical protein